MMHLNSFFFFLLIIFTAITHCFSQPAGSLDPTFNSVGYVRTAIGNSGDHGSKVLVQSDGKIIVAGISHMGNFNGFALVRYNSDGSIDNSFNGNGKVTIHVGDNNYDDYLTSAAIQSDGKIVVVGHSNTGTLKKITLVRFNSNGTIDTSFDSDGIVKTSVGNFDNYASSIKILSNGKILVAGYFLDDFGTDLFCLLKYNSNGSLDNTFDTDGKVSTQILYSENRANDLSVQTDGKIVVVGQLLNNLNFDHDLAIVRYNSNGTLDSSFDGDGKVITDIAGNGEWAYSVGIQSDNKILVAGRTHNSSDYDILIVRYNVDGNLDNTFNGNGIIVKDIDNSDNMAYSLSIQSDQKIIISGVTGYTPSNTQADFVVLRYNTNGSIDGSFGNSGIVTTDLGGSMDAAVSCAIQNDGKILAAGRTNFTSTFDSDFAIARYLENTVEIPEVLNESPWIIFPNPTCGEVTIAENLNELTKIDIYNIHGELVFEQLNFSNNTMQFDLSNYPAGLYFFNLYTTEKLFLKKVTLFK